MPNVGNGTKIQVINHRYWSEGKLLTVEYVYPFENDPDIEVQEDHSHGYGLIKMSDIVKGHVQILND